MRIKNISKVLNRKLNNNMLVVFKKLTTQNLVLHITQRLSFVIKYKTNKQFFMQLNMCFRFLLFFFKFATSI